MLILGIVIGAATVGAAWAKWGRKPDRHIMYIREWARAWKSWRKPKKARHRRRKTMPLLVRTRTIRIPHPSPAETPSPRAGKAMEAPLPMEL